MISVRTFTATIYVGQKITETYEIQSAQIIRNLIHNYCDEVGLCVTLTPTEFIYKGGKEPGIAVGLINYPRFPATEDSIRATALDLAARLKTAMKQIRVSVVFPNETVMLGDLD